jgi:hypothetical protein
MLRTRKIFHTFLNIAAGAGTVMGGAYVFSRLREKQAADTRLDRLEQMIEELSKDKEKK